MSFEATTFLPDDSQHKCRGQVCRGVRFVVEDVHELEPARLGLALIESLRDLYPTTWEYKQLQSLLLRPDLLEAIEDGSSELDDLWQPDPDFFEARAAALLY